MLLTQQVQKIILLLLSSVIVIKTGGILGEGSFCVVKAVHKINIDEEGDVRFNNAILRDVDKKASNCQLYAIKQLRKDLSLHSKREALLDIENEARIMMDVSHAGIVKL